MPRRVIQADDPETFSEIEETLRNIQHSSPSKLAIKLSGHDKGIGINAAIIQIIAAWANSTPHPELVCDQLPQTGAEETEQNNLELLPLTAVCMASEISVASTPEPVRSKFYSKAAITLDNLNAQLGNAQPSSQLSFVCADGTSRAYSDFFYSSSKTLRPLRQFRIQMSKAIHRLSFNENFIHAAISVSDINAVSDIVYELFKNTHQWARTDIYGAALRRSVRGLFLDLVEAERVLENCIGDDALTDFVHRNAKKCSHFFEVSVFDSGPGFAQRFRGRPISEIGDLDNESSAVHGCLKLHSSSADEAHRGVGLHCVLSRLDDFKGFLRLRTGRLALSRSFDVDPYIEREPGMEQIYPHLFNPRLRDFTLKNRGLTEHAQTCGALITAVIPVGEPSS